jgi:3-oxoacyl-[acyl-carrier-protein] synthase-1
MAEARLTGEAWDASGAPVITATGLATSLGRRAANAVAAYRCRLTRTSVSTELKVMDNGTGMEVPMLVHQVVGLTDGYEQVGRWFRLASAAARDLATEHDLGKPRRLGLVAVIPRLSDLRLPDFVDIDEAALPGIVSGTLPATWRVAETRIEYGALGFARAVAVAGIKLAGEWDRAVILAADSFVDCQSLTWLNKTGRLKGDENPVGFIPGEAGACLLLESPTEARRRGATGRARIRTSVVCESDTPSENVEDQAARNIAACLRTALLRVDPANRERAALFTDLNGEPARAQRLGTAMTALTDSLQGATIEHPIECFGETGAVLAPLAACLVVGSFDRGYARSSSAFVLNTDDDGSTACVALERC